jgi:cytochrome c oxidase assembly protein subunit 15
MALDSDSGRSLEAPLGVFGAAVPIGFLVAVAMWTSGYIARLPFVQAHPALLFLFLTAIVVVGGRFSAGAHPRRWQVAITASVVAAFIDLLVLGSYLAEDFSETGRIVVAITSFFVSMIALGLVGAATVSPVKQAWTRAQGLRAMGLATFVATLVMITIGGLVTSEEAGMAVPDWPASFGENMFLLPLSRMTGGIYYEHAHRLYGTLVGLVTLSMMVYFFRQGAGRWLRWGAVLASVQVIFQGILGGIRVTEVRSVTEVGGQVVDWQESAGSLALRVIHGVDGQLFLALTAVLWLLTSRSWNRPAEGVVPRADRWWTGAMAAALLCQLILGALSRHVSRDWMIPHIIGAFAVLGLIMVVGARCTLPQMPPQRVRTGGLLGILATVQVTLGFYALAVTGAEVRTASSGVHETLVATFHQSLGALILSVAAVLLCWTFRGPISGEFGHSGANSPIEKTL